jgi:hypothetical protein
MEDIVSDEDECIARLSLWNSVFPWEPVRVTTDIREHLITRFTAYNSEHNTLLFAFELAVIFVDIPELLESLLSILPLPLRIAVHIAHAVLLDHVERPPPSAVPGMITSLWRGLPPERRPAFAALAGALREGRAELAELLEPFRHPAAALDEVLALLPPLARIHFALCYNRPLPKILLDFADVKLPLEFLQAVADMDGPAAVLSVLRPPEEDASDPGF